MFSNLGKSQSLEKLERWKLYFVAAEDKSQKAKNQDLCFQNGSENQKRNFMVWLYNPEWGGVLTLREKGTDSLCQEELS